jgi:hypothetical protein
MPRIAILADIHGNTPAFDAVAADIDAVAPDEVIVAGDLVGRGPQGNAVVERVIARGWRSVRGNHEDYLINFRRNRVDPTWLISEDWSAGPLDGRRADARLARLYRDVAVLAYRRDRTERAGGARNATLEQRGHRPVDARGDDSDAPRGDRRAGAGVRAHAQAAGVSARRRASW